MSVEQRLLLIDASSYFYRAFHALPPLNNSKGEPTGAVYGVVNMVRRLLKDYPSSYVGCVFDAKGKTFRDDMFSEYKANRDKMPDELSMQFSPLVNVIKAMGIPVLIVDGVEADDVIGTLVTEACQQGVPSIVSTGDKDLAQLVNQHITLVNTMTDTIMDIDGVIKKFGIPPEKIIDYLTLIGDKVDNIPGVNKVGPKTALKWLEQHESLDNIMQHADDVKGKVGENLRDALSHLPLSKALITIKRDVALDNAYNTLTVEAPDTEQLIEYYKQLEFKRLLNEILGGNAEPQEVAKNYKNIVTQKALDSLIKKIETAKFFAFDTETTSLNYMDAELVGLSIAIKPHEAFYIPLSHDYLDAPLQLGRDEVLEQLKPILENNNYKKILQNAKYDMSVLANYNIALQGVAFDTLLESYILNSSQSRHDMNTLALKYLGHNTIHFEDIAGKGAKQKTFNEIDIDTAGEYAAEDADVTLQLHHALWPKLQDNKALQHVFEHIELPLIHVLSHIERTGVLINSELLKQQSGELTIRLAAIEEQVFEMAGETFNIGSPKQLQAILFEKLKLPVLQKTPKGQPSTAESVLTELAYDFPLPKLILEFRSLSKLKSTYTDALPKQVNAKTGRVHTSYNQAVTATGRLSSTAPNLQNIPVRTEEGRRIRQAFIAPNGYKIISADYSQIELRIMAHLSNDKNLQKAFHNGWDVHQATASEVFGVSLDEVTPEQRRHAKAVNFGLIYGMSEFGLARQLEIDRAHAKEYINMYFDRYPGIQDYMHKTRELAHEQGYVETLNGRRLYLPEINARNLQRQRAAERTAINAPMQGTAADIIKLAMINVQHWIEQGDLDIRMVMQVHDELVFEVKAECAEAAKQSICQTMSEAMKLSVPLVVDAGVGDNWDEAH